MFSVVLKQIAIKRCDWERVGGLGKGGIFVFNVEVGTFLNDFC